MVVLEASCCWLQRGDVADTTNRRFLLNLEDDGRFQGVNRRIQKTLNG